MTNTHPQGQVPEALLLADACETGHDVHPNDLEKIAAELRRLHAQVAALTAAPNAKASIHALSQINAAQRELLDAMGAHTAQPAAEGAAKVNWWEVDGDKYDDSITSAPPAPTAQAAPAADPAYSEACSLATALFEKHYRQEPDYASGRVVWSLCDTTAGVISQIDNMVSGLARAPAAGAVAGPITDNPKPGEKYWDISGGLAREQIWQGLSPEWDLLDAGLLFWNEADAVAALSIPASTVVSESEDAQRARIIAAIAQRWIGDRTHLGALVYLDDLAWALKTLAAAPTPAAQADSVLEDAARLLRQILAASQDGDSDTHLSAHFVSRIETITKPGGAA